MGIAFGISWNDSKKGRLFGALIAVGVALSILTSPAATTSLKSAADHFVSVIVRQEPGAGATVREAVTQAGGRVDRRIKLIHGFSAHLPVRAVDDIQRLRGVYSISPNGPVRMQTMSDGFDAAADSGSPYNTAGAVRAREAWYSGITGAGVDVAMVDSGVVPTPELSSNLIFGPDLSFESQSPQQRYLDSYGHGTHMAGIITGREVGVPAGADRFSPDYYNGVAPDARLISVKVANAAGQTDVSQVLAGIDWVVAHRHDNGMDIRVLNLSFGTDGVQSYLVDPLAFAAEAAWRKGIVVVVAAGNRGYGDVRLNNPAYDPYVIAVGADDTKGTISPDDDTVPGWSSRGDGVRNPDVVAPGKSVVSLRDTASFIDVKYPEGIVSSRLFRGSGTSQAAAVVSGASALLLQQRPSLSPDQVKALLTSTAHPVAGPKTADGSGLIDVQAALAAPTPRASQNWTTSSGLGSMEKARGSLHVYSPNGVSLTGEKDIFGTSWNGVRWSKWVWSEQCWKAGDWYNNFVFYGGTWNGNSWSDKPWTGRDWAEAGWSGNSWTGNSWTGNSWSGNSWSGNSWSGNSWTGNSWSGNSWSGNSWSSAKWGGAGGDESTSGEQ